MAAADCSRFDDLVNELATIAKELRDDALDAAAGGRGTLGYDAADGLHLLCVRVVHGMQTVLEANVAQDRAHCEHGHDCEALGRLRRCGTQPSALAHELEPPRVLHKSHNLREASW